MMKKLLNPLAGILLALLVFTGVWLFGAYERWPLWGSLVAGLTAVGVLFFGRRIYRLFQKMVAQRNLRVSAMMDKKIERILSIRNTWKTAQKNVRGASKGPFGNPLATMPFYVVLGNVSSGKTTLLVNASIPIRFRNIPQGEVPPPTDTVEFIFEDQAILLDTSGRYVQVNPNADANDEWKEIETHLRRTRWKSPLNGVIVSLSIEDLWTMDSLQVAQLAQNIRQRVDSLMRSMKSRFPVYLMVTKLDLLAGFQYYVGSLPESRTHEILGTLVQPEEDWSIALKQGLADLVEQVREVLFARADAAIPSSEKLVFPLEVQSLVPLLEPFLKGLFEPSPYLELPLFRGLFLSSGTVQTSRFSSILAHELDHSHEGNLELLEKQPSIPGPRRPVSEDRKSLTLPQSGVSIDRSDRMSVVGMSTFRIPLPGVGVFLRDFFSTLLPSDRDLSVPLGALAKMRRFSANIPLMGWYGANLLVGLYFSYSFVDAYRTIGTLEQRQPTHVSVAGDFHQSLENLERYRSLIDWMGQKDQSISGRFLAFSGAARSLERMMKDRYVADFSKIVLPSLNVTLRKKIRSLLIEDPQHQLADYADILVRRINLIKGRQEGMSYAVLRDQPQPGTKDIVTIDPSISPQEARHFSDLYLAYIAWVPDEMVGRNLDFLQSLLLELEQTVPDFHWLVDWVNSQGAPPITLADFWKGTQRLDNEVSIPLSYSNEGVKRIYHFLGEVQKASPSNFPIRDHEQSFLSWYRTRKNEAWLRFVQNFSMGKESLADNIQWQAVFHRLPTAQNPYVELINRLNVEFPLSQDVHHDRWQAFFREILKIEKYQESQAGLVSRIKGYANILNDSGITGLHGGLSRGHRQFVSLLSASKAYNRFSKDLAGVVREGVQGRGHALALTAAYYSFSHNSGKKAPALVDAQNQLELMKQLLLRRADPQELIVWKLVEGQFDTTLDYLDREAACEVNDRWVADVVSPAQSALTERDLNHFLLGSGGAIPAFMDKTMSPFVTRMPGGYRLIRKEGRSLGIRSQFLTYINSAISGRRSLELAMKRTEIESKKRHLDLATLRQSLQKAEQDDTRKILDMSKKQFAIVLRALPTDVNTGSLAKPYLTRLTLACAEKAHTLNNFNLPVRRSWVWSPLTCGKTVLSLRIGSLTADKVYSGPDGFVHFLQQFYQGTLRLVPADFPLQQDALKNLRITEIRVRFHFTGAHALLAQYQQYTLARESRKRIRDKIRQIDTELSILDQNDLTNQQDSLKNRPFASGKLPGQIASCLSGEEEAPMPSTQTASVMP
jgi:type VI secretion system protein ImpL